MQFTHTYSGTYPTFMIYLHEEATIAIHLLHINAIARPPGSAAQPDYDQDILDAVVIVI